MADPMEQSAEQQRVLDAMMDDLGNGRLEDVARDDHRDRFALDPTAATIAAHSQAANPNNSWARYAQEDIFNDDDARAVKDLDPIANGRLHAIHKAATPRTSSRGRGLRSGRGMNSGLRGGHGMESVQARASHGLLQPSSRARDGRGQRGGLSYSGPGRASLMVSSLGGVVPEGATTRRWEPGHNRSVVPADTGSSVTPDHWPMSTPNPMTIVGGERDSLPVTASQPPATASSQFRSPRPSPAVTFEAPIPETVFPPHLRKFSTVPRHAKPQDAEASEEHGGAELAVQDKHVSLCSKTEPSHCPSTVVSHFEANVTVPTMHEKNLVFENGRTLLYELQEQDIIIWELQFDSGSIQRRDLRLILECQAPSTSRVFVTRQDGPDTHSATTQLSFSESNVARDFWEQITELRSKAKKSTTPIPTMLVLAKEASNAQKALSPPEPREASPSPDRDSRAAEDVGPRSDEARSKVEDTKSEQPMKQHDAANCEPNNPLEDLAPPIDVFTGEDIALASPNHQRIAEYPGKSLIDLDIPDADVTSPPMTSSSYTRDLEGIIYADNLTDDDGRGVQFAVELPRTEITRLVNAESGVKNSTLVKCSHEGAGDLDLISASQNDVDASANDFPQDVEHEQTADSRLQTGTNEQGNVSSTPVATNAGDEIWTPEAMEQVVAGLDLCKQARSIMATIDNDAYCEMNVAAEGTRRYFQMVHDHQGDEERWGALQVSTVHFQKHHHREFVVLDVDQKKRLVATVYANVRRLQTRAPIVITLNNLLALRQCALYSTSSHPAALDFLNDMVVECKRITGAAIPTGPPPPHHEYRPCEAARLVRSTRDFFNRAPQASTETSLDDHSGARRSLPSVAHSASQSGHLTPLPDLRTSSPTEYIAIGQRLSEQGSMEAAIPRSELNVDSSHVPPTQDMHGTLPKGTDREFIPPHLRGIVCSLGKNGLKGSRWAESSS